MAAMRGSATGRQRAASGTGVDAGRGDSRRPGARLGATVGTVALIVSAAVALGCGDSAQKREARALEGSSILSDTAPLDQRLVKQKEIAAAPDSAAQRTFLELWSTLQFGAWDRAEQFFQPGLRGTIGPAVLAQGLEQYLLVWQGSKPRIVTARAAGDTATITFLARDEKDRVVPASISFTRSNGSWLVSYFSLLDGALQRAVQLAVQARLEPLGIKPSAEAVRQGNVAATLQSTYLESQLGSSAAAGKAGRAGRRR
jgi:hypothetical protein